MPIKMRFFRAKCLLAVLLPAFHTPVFAGYVCRNLSGGEVLRCRYGDECGISGGLSVCSSKNGTYKPSIGVREGERTGFKTTGKKGGIAGALCMSTFTPLLLAAENARADDWDTKLKYYSQAIQGWTPCDGAEKLADVYTRRGFVFSRISDYDDAADDFSAAIGYNPKDPLPHYYLGVVHYNRRNYTGAIAEFNYSVKLGLEIKNAEAAYGARSLRAAAVKKQEKAGAQNARVLARNLSGKPFSAPARPHAPGGQPPLLPPGAAAVSLPNPAVVAQGASAHVPRRFSGWTKPSASLPLSEHGAPPETGQPSSGKPAGNEWIVFCIIGFLLSAAVFLGVTYLALRGDQARIRERLRPLADALGVNIRWMFFGFFIPPESEFHGKLLISLASCSALGALAACFAFFNFSLDNALKILSGVMVSGVLSCLSVFASCSLKSGSGDAAGRPQAGQIPAAPRSDARVFTLPAATGTPEAAANCESDSSAARSRQVKALMDAGNYQAALELLSLKGALKISGADKDRLFEIYIRLRDFDRAGTLFGSLDGSGLPAENIRRYEELACICHAGGGRVLARRICRGLFEAMKTAPRTAGAAQYYSFAALCENMDNPELAREILRHMIGAGFEKYRDVAARYGELKARLLVAVSPAQNSSTAAGAWPVLNNQYEIRGELGEGGMAKVYEGRDRKSGRKVAVKKMHPWLKKFPQEYRRFVQEARIVSRLAHPNIVGVQAIVEQEGEIYLIFDYVDGKTLCGLLKEKGILQLQECKDIFKGVCGAVGYAHKSKVIHRDLKPSNIMVDTNGVALVMDFGLASELRESLTRVTHQTSSGTPAYMAPEQHLGVVKRESDIYAMGVCLYEMLTGKLPFAAGDVLQLKKDREFREVSAMLPWLPGRVDEIIARSLAPEPSQRFADAMDFFNALSDL